MIKISIYCPALTQTHTHTHKHTHTQINILIRILISTHTCTNTYTHTYTFINSTHTQTHTVFTLNFKGLKFHELLKRAKFTISAVAQYFHKIKFNFK